MVLVAATPGPECVERAEWDTGVCNLEFATRLVRSSERDILVLHFAGAQFVSTDFIFFVATILASTLSPSRMSNKRSQQHLKTGCKITFPNKTNHLITEEKD